MPSAAAKIDVTASAARVDEQLARFLAARKPMLAAAGPETAALQHQASLAVAGGKRLRAAFCLAGWLAAGGSVDHEGAERAAAALELLQASALVHDDWMDGSDTRRGRPAAHRAFAHHHRAAGWVGDPDRFGAGAAILLGDLLLTWAHELLRSSGFDPVTIDRTGPVFDACTTEVTAGQYLDLVSQATGASDEELALRVVRFKCASYTVVRPLQLGATLAGAGEDLLAELTTYGSPVGVAYQLRDDVLGVFGDPKQTGKPAGDDLREGKRTVLLARTYDRTDDAGRALLDRCVGDPVLDPADVRRLRELMVGSGALASIEQTIVELETQAGLALDRVVAAATGCTTRSTLETLTSVALQRDR